MTTGLRDHVAEHWQTVLQACLPKTVSVPPLEQDKLSCTARVAALGDAIAKLDGPIVLVAQGADVMITVRWARHHNRPIQGALLAALVDLEVLMPADHPTPDVLEEQGWLSFPRKRLPLPSILGASRNAPPAAFDRAAIVAADWYSRLADLGEVAHRNPPAGHGEWPDADTLTRALH